MVHCSIPWYKIFVPWWYKDVQWYTIIYHCTSKLFHMVANGCTMVQIQCTIIIQLITLRQLKCSCLSNFHHQPGDFFRTGLLWHSTAAVLCHNKPVLKKSPGWWWKFDKHEHFNCLSVINCIIINFYQTNEPLQEYNVPWYTIMYHGKSVLYHACTMVTQGCTMERLQYTMVAQGCTMVRSHCTMVYHCLLWYTMVAPWLYHGTFS